MSNHAFITVSDALRHRRAVLVTRWRRLSACHRALLVVAELQSGTPPNSPTRPSASAPRTRFLTVGDYLSAYVMEWTLHHLDLIAHLPSAAEPPAEALAAARGSLEKIAGALFPASFPDKDALLVGTGRRAPTDAEKAALGELAAKIPPVLG